MKKKLNNTLFWKISGIFFFFIVGFSLIYFYVFISSAKSYVNEVNQELGRNIAEHTVQEIKPFVNGEVNEEAVQHIMHSMMTINPSVEVYLLDAEGAIVTYVAPYKEVVLTAIELEPVKCFVQNETQGVILGDNPRLESGSSIFSAAEVKEDDQLLGYVYIVLASQEYESVSEALLSSNVIRLLIKSLLLILLSVLIIGILAVWFLTKNINIISEQVAKFKAGDLSARINLKSQGEFSDFADSFNAMANQIETNVDELKGVEKLRRELIANVSHDLRSPISSIMGYIETVLIKLDNLSNDKIKEYLEIALKNSKKLGVQITNLFQLSKLEANDVKLKKELAQISELAIDAVNKFKILANKKGIQVNSSIPAELPLVELDIALIDKVLQNIFENAIKYSKEGDTINVSLNSKLNKIEVRITDTGEGISELDLTHIFDRHYQSNSQQTNKGTGLGLAIVKKILELHNATIKVTSALNKGTSFAFELPLE